MAKKNYRKTTLEREQHNTAVKVRKMTDEQLCAFLDDIQRQSAEETAKKIIDDLTLMTVNRKNTIDHAIKSIRRMVEGMENEIE